MKTPNSWPVVVSFGGGTNSAAMLIEMQHRGVVPDLITFADTGGELPETVKLFDELPDELPCGCYDGALSTSL